MASTFMQNWPASHRNLLSVSIVLLLIFLGIAYFIVYPMWREYDEEHSEYEENEHKVATSQWPRDAERMQGLLNSYKKILGAGSSAWIGSRVRSRPSPEVRNTRSLAANAVTATTVEEQTRQAITNLKNVLEAAGAGLDKVVKTTVFISDMNDFAAINAVYAEMFGDTKPARSCVEVARLPKDVLVEIECIAAE